MSQARRFERLPKKRLRKKELPHMETNEQAQRERYQEVERTLVKLVEEIEEIEDGDLKELEQKIYKGVLEVGRQLFQCRINKGGEKAARSRWEKVGMRNIWWITERNRF